MKITDLFIKRPVLAMVLSIAIFILGFFGLLHLPIRQYPLVSADQITITTNYPGASAETMAGFVTQPIEAAVSTVSGVNYMTGANTKGTSTITCVLNLGADADAILTNIAAQVNSVRWKLPKNVQPPIVAKQNVSSQPMFFMALGSDSMTLEQISDFAARVIQPQLETLPGIESINIYGAHNYAMRIWLDPYKMASQKITASDVASAISNNNTSTAAGYIATPQQEYAVTADTELHTTEEFNNIVIKANADSLIRIKDIGQAALETDEDNVNTMIDGFKNSVVVAVIPRSTASTISVSAEISKALTDKIIRQMPPTLKTKLLFNTAVFVKQSIEEIISTFAEAIILVMLVIYLFIGNFRSAFIPAVAIPLSVIGVASLMQLMGYSINTLTLLALVLAIGLVVDDAIVVLENIHRHIEHGLSPLQAALIGAAEIRFAIIAMTFTLAAVFAPIGFTGGLTGALFKEFAFTLAMTVIVSGVIALTLSPMMCSRIMPADLTHGSRFEAWVNETFNRLQDRYKHWLAHLLNFRAWLAVLVAVLLIAIAGLIHIIPAELAPEEYEGIVLAIAIGPTAASPDYMKQQMQLMAPIFHKLPEVTHYGLVTGYPFGRQSGIGFISLSSYKDRKRSDPEIIQALVPPIMGIPGIMAFVKNRPSLPGAGNLEPIAFVLQTTNDYLALNKLTQAVLDEAKKNPGLMNLRTDLKLDKPEIMIKIDKSKALNAGIDLGQISSTLAFLLGKPQIDFFTYAGRSYPIVPQMYKEFRLTPQQLNNIYLRTKTGTMVPLASVANITEDVIPQSLNDFEQFHAATISGSLAPGYTIGQALDSLVNIAKQKMTKADSYDFSGSMREYVTSGNALTQAFIFALVFIFLLLAAQFESFRDPLIILLSVPTSIFGALLFIYFSGGTLNIFTKIGLITLIGLISKHGILIVNVANELQHKGKAIRDAVVEAASVRLRPVLMTTFAMILGVVPLVLARGPGSIARHQLGWTIIGGMSVGTLMTLFIVPAIYTYLATQKTIDAVA